MLVLTDGELRWDDAAHDFDWPASSAVPRALAGAFDAEPRWIDLRFARALDAPSLRDPRFRSAVADLAAPLHGRAKEELVGDDVREHRRTMRIARAAVALLVALAAAASFAALTAVRQRDRAEQQLRLATSRLLSAEASAAVARQHSQALLLALEAHESSPTAEARAALYGGLVRLPQALRYLQPRSGGPQRIALSPDGRTLVAGTTGGTLELFDTRTGRRTGTLALGEGTVSDLAFAPTGETLAAVDGTGAVRLVDPDTARTRAGCPRFRAARARTRLPSGRADCSPQAAARASSGSGTRTLIGRSPGRSGATPAASRTSPSAPEASWSRRAARTRASASGGSGRRLGSRQSSTRGRGERRPSGSAPTAGGSPQAPRTARSRSGQPKTGMRSVARAVTPAARPPLLPSARTAPCWSRAASTTPCACGTRAAASRAAGRFGATSRS